MNKIAFVWQGLRDRYGHWKDGLWLAMKHLEKTYEVSYYDINDEIPSDAIVMYWEAPCTINGPYGDKYRRIMNLPNKKILLFAGGPIQKEWVSGFDIVCVESAINKDEFDAIGVNNITAFGINDEIFKPRNIKKQYKAIHHATCASWKRQWLVAEAFGNDCILVGRYQSSDPRPFDESILLGANVIGEQSYERIAELLNESEVLAQTSEYWGGGQRATLEAMACGVPVICMSDSPKNREYVEESGAGIVCEPNKEDILRAYNEIQSWTKEQKERGIEYIKSKWTGKHYADSLKEAINKIQ